MATISLISIVQKIFKLPTPPKVWVSGFLSVNGNGISVSAIMKKLKVAAISLISIVQKNFKLLTPPKFGSLVFQVSTEMEYQHQPLRKN